jgi:hypothetical protein
MGLACAAGWVAVLTATTVGCEVTCSGARGRERRLTAHTPGG